MTVHHQNKVRNPFEPLPLTTYPHRIKFWVVKPGDIDVMQTLLGIEGGWCFDVGTYRTLALSLPATDRHYFVGQLG